MAIFPQQKVTGPGGVAMTPDEVSRKRAIATALMGQAGNTSPVGHWTAALNRGLQGFTSSYDNLMANRAEAEGMGIADALAAQNGLTGGGNPSPIAQALSGGNVAYNGAAPTSAFPASLIESESGGNWNALNNEGYGGRLQFGEARLSDAANAGIIPAGLSGADFSRLSPEQQMAVENWHFADIDRQAQRMGLDQYIGQNIGGAPITQDAIRGMAHLGGIGGAAKFLQSGGQYNPADSNGTSLLDYALRHGGGSAGSGVSPAPSASNVAGLTAAMGNPWFRQQYGDVAQALMGQQMSQQNAAYEAQLRQADPAYQLDMQMKQAQINSMMNPDPWAGTEVINGRVVRMGDNGLEVIGDFSGGGAGQNPADFLALELRAEAAGLTKGTPEYQEFMLNGGRPSGGLPAATEALHQQAILGGLTQGTPEYQEFMRTRGAGDAAAATTTATATAEQAIAAPSVINASEDTLLYIDELLNHPGLAGGTGADAFRALVPGTKERDFAARVEQLEGGAFLTAIDEMAGMGALSNQEGQTAKAAIARLSRAQSQSAFEAALEDYRRIIIRGRERAQSRIRADGTPMEQQQGGQGQTITDEDLFKKYGIE